MVLERMINAIGGNDESPWEPAHAPGSVHRKVTILVHEVSNLKAQSSGSKSKMWYTIKAASLFNAKAQAMGKVESKRVECQKGVFGTSHEMLVDTTMVQTLVLKLKTTGSILSRKVTVGTYSFSLSGGVDAPKQHLEETLPLKNNKGELAGNIRLTFTVTPTDLPALHYAPRPFWKPSPDVLTRPYSALVREGFESFGGAAEDCHMVSYFQGQSSSIKVQGTDHRYMAKQHGKDWKIFERVGGTANANSGKKFVLQCHTPADDKCKDASPSTSMDFSLHQTGGVGGGKLSLVKGNIFNAPASGDAAWGVWTLVRQLEGEKSVNADQFVALIHIAGPVVECRCSHEVALALVVANAMFWSCMVQHGVQQRVHERIHDCFLAPAGVKLPEGKGTHGRGFFVLPGDAASSQNVTELRSKMSGIGKHTQREERCVAGFLHGGKGADQESLVMSSVLVAKEFDWGGRTFLGLPIF